MAKSPKKAVPVATKQFGNTERNREARLERHIKKYPNDTVAQKAAANPAPVRSKPKTKGNYPEKTYFARDAAGNKERISIGFTGYELPAKTRQSPKAFEEEVRRVRKELSDTLSSSKGQFGNVTKRSEAEIKENVKALCFGLGIRFTGKTANRTRKAGK